MTDPMTPLTAESEALLAEVHGTQMALTVFPARLRAIEAAAARRAIEGSGVVEWLGVFMVAFEETGVHEHERDDDSIDLCIPIAPLKPVYWAACAAAGHRWTVVDVEPFCERCGFREGDDEDDATLAAVVQSAEHRPGDCAAVEEAGSSPARGDALPRPEEPRVERCWFYEPYNTDPCGRPKESAVHDAVYGSRAHHPFTPEAR